MEKASIDEVYIDVTSMVEAELRSLAGGGAAADTAGAGAANDAGDTAGFGEPHISVYSNDCQASFSTLGTVSVNIILYASPNLNFRTMCLDVIRCSCVCCYNIRVGRCGGKWAAAHGLRI